MIEYVVANQIIEVKLTNLLPHVSVFLVALDGADHAQDVWDDNIHPLGELVERAQLADQRQQRLPRHRLRLGRGLTDRFPAKKVTFPAACRLGSNRFSDNQSLAV